MISKKKICSICKKESYIWKTKLRIKYCKSCWSKISPKVISTKPKKAIRKVSKKREYVNQIYSRKRKEFLSLPKNSTCRAKLSCCLYHTGLDLTIHHSKGRGRYYLDTSTWIPLCLACHQWVENNPEEFRILGFTFNRK